MLHRPGAAALNTQGFSTARTGQLLGDDLESIYQIPGGSDRSSINAPLCAVSPSSGVSALCHLIDHCSESKLTDALIECGGIEAKMRNQPGTPTKGLKLGWNRAKARSGQGQGESLSLLFNPQ